MNISFFIQNSLKIIWVIFAISILILPIGWILSRLIAEWVVSLLNRTPAIERVVRLLRLTDPEPVKNSIKKTVRIIIVLFTFWAAWEILNINPVISGLINSMWHALIVYIKQPAVTIIFNLILIFLAFILLIKAFGWIKNWFSAVGKRIESEKGNLLRGFSFQQVEIVTAEQQTGFLINLFRYIHYAVNIIMALVFLTFVFSFFPQTQGLVAGIINRIFWIMADIWTGFIRYLPRLLNLAVIIVITHYSLKLIRLIFREIQKGAITFSGFYPEWAMPTFQIVRILVIAMAFVIAFPLLPGYSSPAFKGISVFIGLLFSLGSTSIISNIVSGVVLTYTRAFKLGDRVKIADTVGDVIEKGLFATRVRTIKNVEITIPNGMVFGSHIVNYSSISSERGLILNTTLTLGYDISWRLIHETLINAALSTGGILAEPRPFVLQTSLNDFYVSYELNAYTDQPQKMALIYSDLHSNIHDFCDKAGIEILSPHYNSLRDGNATSVSPESLPKDYQSPPFNVKLKRELGERKKSNDKI